MAAERLGTAASARSSNGGGIFAATAFTRAGLSGSRTNAAIGVPSEEIEQ
jgi:hypothetical protein